MSVAQDTARAGPDISAVVCTYRRPEQIGRALESLRRQTLPAARYEVIVVDNAPEDRRTSAAVEGACGGGLKVEYVTEPRLGLSHARNRGIEAARGDIVAFMDDDAVAAEGWLGSLVSSFEGQAVRPLAVGGPVRPVWHSRRPSWLPSSFLSMLSLVDYGPEARALRFPAEFLVGCNLALEASFLRDSGGFDIALGRKGDSLFGNEDTDVLGRVGAAGGAVIYQPGALVQHHIPAERERLRWYFRRMYYQGISDVLTEGRHSRAALTTQSLGGRLLSHLRWSLSQVLTHPTHGAFTIAMAGAYGLGRAKAAAR